MVNLTLRVLSKPDMEQLPTIFKSLGLDYDERVLPSIGNEVLKAVVAQFKRRPASHGEATCKFPFLIVLSLASGGIEIPTHLPWTAFVLPLPLPLALRGRVPSLSLWPCSHRPLLCYSFPPVQVSKLIREALTLPLPPALRPPLSDSPAAPSAVPHLSNPDRGPPPIPCAGLQAHLGGLDKPSLGL